MNEKKYDLDSRLIDFAVLMIKMTESLPKSKSGNYLSGQLLKSGTAPALLYAEAHAAESSNDFIHKMKVTLKELRETYNGLRIILKLNWKTNECLPAVNEVNQLISIFVKSIKTTQANLLKKGNNKSNDGNNTTNNEPTT